MAAQGGEPRQAVEIAANAETAIAGKIPHAIEDRQARQFDRQTPPPSTGQFSVMPLQVCVRGKRLHHAAIGIEREGFGDLAPQPAEAGRGARADQAGELVGAEREAAF